MELNGPISTRDLSAAPCSWRTLRVPQCPLFLLPLVPLASVRCLVLGGRLTAACTSEQARAGLEVLRRFARMRDEGRHGLVVQPLHVNRNEVAMCGLRHLRLVYAVVLSHLPEAAEVLRLFLEGGRPARIQALLLCVGADPQLARYPYHARCLQALMGALEGGGPELHTLALAPLSTPAAADFWSHLGAMLKHLPANIRAVRLVVRPHTDAASMRRHAEAAIRFCAASVRSLALFSKWEDGDLPDDVVLRCARACRGAGIRFDPGGSPQAAARWGAMLSLQVPPEALPQLGPSPRSAPAHGRSDDSRRSTARAVMASTVDLLRTEGRPHADIVQEVEAVRMQGPDASWDDVYAAAADEVQLVLREKLLLDAPGGGAQAACGWCGKAGGADAPLLTCGRCRAVRYCCMTCQRLDWRLGGHKRACSSSGQQA